MPNKKIQALIFDFDGTLVDSVDAYLRLFLELGERFGNRPVTKEDFLEMNGMAVQEALMKLVRERLFKLRVIPYVMWHLRKFKKRVVDETAPYPFVHETLSQLKQHYPLAMVTSNQWAHVRNLRTRYDLEKYFEHTITQDDVKERKPLPQPFLKMAKKLNLAPENCLVIEDTPYGVWAAHRAGMNTCVVEHTTPQKYFKDEYIPQQFISNLSVLTPEFIEEHYER